jgi:UDP-2-acetamido-3-amino-2,3-dideoxy-glucuronate N-acetyltransferase
MSDAVVHPTALIEHGVELGPGTRVWDNVHIRHGARIGHDCIIGGKTYIAYDVRIGSFVKINSNVYVCARVTVEDFVMISAHVVFTNDRFPRAFRLDFSGLATSDVTEETLPTLVRKGATIGANATIGPGVEIGEWAMVGMGSVVTQSIGANALVYGNPARHQGYVCCCGLFLGSVEHFAQTAQGEVHCSRCKSKFARSSDGRILVLRQGQGQGVIS